jgi:hypothetical protein
MRAALNVTGGKATLLEMEQRREQIARRLIWNQPVKQIIEELNITYGEFRHTTQNSQFEELKTRIAKELWSALDEKYRKEMGAIQFRAKETAGEAIDKLIILMRSSASESLQRECANDIIEYSGEASRKNDKPAIVINKTTMQLIKQTIAEEDGPGTIDSRAELIN